jgi:hypothetical protein
MAERAPITCCSFGDTTGPLGIVLLEGTHSKESAEKITSFLHLNPGGHLVVMHSPEDMSDESYENARRHLNRFLRADQIEGIFAEAQVISIEVVEGG